MGQCCCLLYACLFEPPVVRVLMLGLDNGGKKTTLEHLGTIISFEPALNFQVDTVDHKELYIRSWDIGGFWQPKSLWRHFYRYTEALIFVVDSGDLDRIYEARDAIQEILRSPELSDAKILILANKQVGNPTEPRLSLRDLNYAMPLSQIMEVLEIDKMQGRVWHIQPTCALTGAGVTEGIEWLYDELLPKKSGRGDLNHSNDTVYHNPRGWRWGALSC